MNDSFNTDQADEGGQILSGLKAIQEMTEQVQEGTGAIDARSGVRERSLA